MRGIIPVDFLARLSYNLTNMTEPSLGNSEVDQEESLPYRLRERFLTTPEVALFRVLKDMAEGRYVVFAKVALNDIFYIVRPNENVHYFNKLFRKHVDFLLCKPDSLKPQIGVELVRPASKKAPRTSDRFMEELFLTAGLPLVQIPSSDRYELSEVITLFQSALEKAKQMEGRPAGNGQESVPMCPVCGKMMVLRTHRSGPEAGQLYYGCIDSPGCPGTVSLK